MQEQKTPKKPLIYYAIIAFTALMLLNTFIFPTLLQRDITETDYSAFLTHLDENKIQKFELDDQTIFYVAEVEGEEKLFTTGAMPDPDLTNRLKAAGVEFTRIVPQEASPIVSFIASWVLPLLIFFFLGRLLMGYMQ